MTDEEPRKIATIGHLHAGKSHAAAMLIAAAAAAGMTVVTIGDDRGRRLTGRWEDELLGYDFIDPLDTRPRDAMGFRHVPPEVGMYRGRVYDLYAQAATRLSQTPHIDTPKPVSKRRARRLRGKAERKAS